MDRLLLMFEHETIDAYVLRNMQSQKDKTRHATLEEVQGIIQTKLIYYNSLGNPVRYAGETEMCNELLKAIEGLEK